MVPKMSGKRKAWDPRSVKGMGNVAKSRTRELRAVFEVNGGVSKFRTSDLQDALFSLDMLV